MGFQLKEADRVEILTLQDNYIDALAMDGTQTVQRAVPVKDGEVRNSILAEHGFSALVTVTAGGRRRTALFDFGFSDHGAATNAETLQADLGEVEAMVLSHGHMDHFGGVERLAARAGGRPVELFLHPAAFRKGRYLKITEELKIGLPALGREKLEESGASIVETREARPLLDRALLFLGEIPRKTPFERGFPRMFYLEDGQEKWDPIEDDTAVVAHLAGKGLVVLSGCAHSGIVNTVRYAREVTGVEPVHVVMGGFHLTGPDFETVIRPTLDALRALRPDYVIPTHCTGRKAILEIEREMPEEFLLNMSGTKMVFEA